MYKGHSEAPPILHILLPRLSCPEHLEWIVQGHRYSPLLVQTCTCSLFATASDANEPWDQSLLSKVCPTVHTYEFSLNSAHFSIFRLRGRQ